MTGLRSAFRRFRSWLLQDIESKPNKQDECRRLEVEQLETRENPASFAIATVPLPIYGRADLGAMAIAYCRSSSKRWPVTPTWFSWVTRSPRSFS
jgi:hypothetical protein